MALTPALWLVDKSVLARVDVPAVADAVLLRVQAGQVGVALVTELVSGDAWNEHGKGCPRHRG